MFVRPCEGEDTLKSKLEFNTATADSREWQRFDQNNAL